MSASVALSTPTATTSTDRVRAVAVAAAAVAQVAAGAFGGSQTGALSDANISPVTPATYAFAIWGLIYLAALGLAVYQLLPSQQGREIHRRTGWWLVAAFASSTVWIPAFGAQLFWLAQVIIVVLLFSLAMAAARMATTPARDLGERALLRLPTTLYLGWAALASMAGFGLTFRSFGMPADGIQAIVASLALIATATVLGVLVTLRFTALAGFAFTAGWALVAIALGSYSSVIVVAAVLALVVVVATLVVRVGRSDRKAQLLLG